VTHPAAKPLLPGIHIILGDSAGGIFTRIYHARDRLLIDHDGEEPEVLTSVSEQCSDGQV
jgi:hypothetical protein